ncbi:putative WRKY transcription factor 20 [Dorcoceras hygrometricum]|uniref:Putative WRKY transcription factor 20 n=1 Tax=Dorcoceras hygrometricum TaxID=472368 RepID=A0A2Z7D464_9LAMI|nr:putative WRKY transcription factor 20 [Dorcoceras hygrometricum]
MLSAGGTLRRRFVYLERCRFDTTLQMQRLVVAAGFVKRKIWVLLKETTGICYEIPTVHDISTGPDRNILQNVLITIRGSRLLNGTSSSRTSTSPRRNLYKTLSLALHSVQLCYLKNLQWATQTQGTQKQEKGYEVKPQIGHLGQRVSWQYPVEPLYNAQPISQWKSSVRDIQVWPLTITAQWYSGTTSQSATTLMISLDLSGATHLSVDHNVNLIWFSINQQAQYRSPYASIYNSRQVSIERPKHDELSATSLTPNNGGNRRKSTGEGFGEQYRLRVNEGEEMEIGVENTLSVGQHLYLKSLVKIYSESQPPTPSDPSIRS